MSTAFVLVALALGAFLGYSLLRKRKNALSRVPGPKELPFLGSILAINWPSIHLQMTDWSKKYGPVFKFSMLGQNFVVLSSEQAGREALLKRGADFAGRPFMYRQDRITLGKSIVFKTWTDEIVEKRKVVEQMLALHGGVLGRLEDIMRDQMSELLSRLEKIQGEPFNVQRETGAFVLNSICILLYGEGYSYDDPTFDKHMELTSSTLELLSVTSDGQELDVFPWLRFTGLCKQSLKKLERVEELQKNLLSRKLNEARASLDPNNPRGVVDDLLLRMLNGSSDVSSFQWNDEHIFATVQDIVNGGVAASVRSLQTAFSLFIKYPALQTALQEEIDRVIGALQPSITHRSSMPYTEAFIMELLRYTSLLPMLVPHSTMVDSTVAGYEIPSNCTVLINAWAIHHNEDVYEKPFEFLPQRFLDSQGKPLSFDHPRKTSLLAFGAGKRVCPGENFAFGRLFFIIVSIMQRFTFGNDESRPNSDPDPRKYDMDIMLRPPDCHVRAFSRH